jgi:cytochrome c
MKFSPIIAIAGALIAAPAFANPAALQLAQKSNCVACHAADAKLVGPSWKDISKKYQGDATAEAKLVAKVKKGGAGVWGPVPMPPNVTVKDADIKTLVQWVLSGK